MAIVSSVVKLAGFLVSWASAIFADKPAEFADVIQLRIVDCALPQSSAISFIVIQSPYTPPQKLHSYHPDFPLRSIDFKDISRYYLKNGG
jgi:hypothetical protein